MAPSHSVDTQQQHYQTDALQEIQATSINKFYRNKCKIIEEEMKKGSAMPFISDKYTTDLRKDLEEAIRSREEQFHRWEEAKEENEVVRGNRTLTANVKYKILKLIIYADDVFDKGKYNLNLHLANDLSLHPPSI